MKKLVLFILFINFSLVNLSQSIQGLNITKLEAFRVNNISYCDFDGDGLTDLVGVGGTIGIEGGTPFTNNTLGFEKVFWYRNLGDYNFGQRIILSNLNFAANCIETVDIDNDGDFDVVFSDYENIDYTNYNAKIKGLINNGNGQIEDTILIYYTERDLINFTLTKFNENDSWDIIIRNSTEDSMGILTPPRVLLDFYENDSIATLDLASIGQNINCQIGENGNNILAINSGGQYFSELNIKEYGQLNNLISDTILVCNGNPTNPIFSDINFDGQIDLMYCINSNFYYRLKNNLSWGSEILFLNGIQGSCFSILTIPLPENLTEIFYLSNDEFDNKYLVKQVIDEQLEIIYSDSIIINYNNTSNVIKIERIGFEERIFITEYTNGVIACNIASIGAGFNSQISTYLANDNPIGIRNPMIGDFDSDGKKDILLDDGWYRYINIDSFSFKNNYLDEDFLNNKLFFGNLNNDTFEDFIFSNELGKYVKFGNANGLFEPPIQIGSTMLPYEENSSGGAFKLNSFFNDSNLLFLLSYYSSDSSNVNSTVVRAYRISSENVITIAYEYQFENLIFQTRNFKRFNSVFDSEVIQTFFAQTIGEKYLIKLFQENSFEVVSMSNIFNGNGKIQIADFNSDGLDDVIYLNLELFQNSLDIYLQTINNSFQIVNQVDFDNSQINDFTCLDLNGDNNLDILIGSRNYPKLQALFNENGFQSHILEPFDSSFGSVKNIILDNSLNNRPTCFITNGSTQENRVVFYPIKENLVTSSKAPLYFQKNDFKKIFLNGKLKTSDLISQFKTVYIYDLIGNKLKSIDYVNKDELIDLSPGIYIIIINIKN